MIWRPGIETRGKDGGGKSFQVSVLFKTCFINSLGKWCWGIKNCWDISLGAVMSKEGGVQITCLQCKHWLSWEQTPSALWEKGDKYLPPPQRPMYPLHPSPGSQYSTKHLKAKPVHFILCNKALVQKQWSLCCSDLFWERLNRFGTTETRKLHTEREKKKERRTEERKIIQAGIYKRPLQS